MTSSYLLSDIDRVVLQLNPVGILVVRTLQINIQPMDNPTDQKMNHYRYDYRQNYLSLLESVQLDSKQNRPVVLFLEIGSA